MYIQMGNNSIIRNEDIIGIFAVDSKSSWYAELKNPSAQKYKVVDLCKDGKYASCVVTDKCLYLSGISTNTLRKRAESKFWLKGLNLQPLMIK